MVPLREIRTYQKTFWLPDVCSRKISFETVCYAALLLQKSMNTAFSFVDTDTVWSQMHKKLNTSAKKKKKDLREKCQYISSGWLWKMDGLVALIRNINHIISHINNRDNGINGLPLLKSSGIVLASGTVGSRCLKDIVRTPSLSIFILRFYAQASRPLMMASWTLIILGFLSPTPNWSTLLEKACLFPSGSSPNPGIVRWAHLGSSSYIWAVSEARGWGPSEVWVYSRRCNQTCSSHMRWERYGGGWFTKGKSDASW